MNTELIARLEAAEVGSREFDRELMAISYSYEQRYIGINCWDDADGTCCPDGKHLSWVWVDPATNKWKTNAVDGYDFTTSLDAALALAERVLPLGSWRIEREGAVFWAKLWWDREGKAGHKYADAKTPALALCIAILRALDAQGQK